MDGDCVEIYLATCDRNQVPPQVAIVRGLQEQEINVRHRYLGDQDAHALSAALCVRIDLATHVDRSRLCRYCCSVDPLYKCVNVVATAAYMYTRNKPFCY